MASYTHKQNSHVSKKKVTISYVIRDKEERCHRSGVNSLQYDPYLDRLYSAGRDSVIRRWGFTNNVDSSTNRANQPKQGSTYYNEVRQNGKQQSSPDDHYLQSMEHHTDWVNDIILCCNGRNLISVSNDTTIKVWSAHQGFCLSTLRSHKDYAKCLAYASDRDVVASAGFDRMIYLWDIQALTMLTATKNTVTTKPLDGSKNSIYSLAINQSGTLVASGSTEKVIRLWDPRSRQKLLKLRGHTDNVRSLLFSKDGSLLLSASSDGTIRLWSIAQQRCISIIRVHDEGVWTIQANEAFNTVYSGGKDCKVYMTDLRDTSNSELICRESAPILRILLVDRCYSMKKSSEINDNASLWISTTNSSIKNWSLPKDTDAYRDAKLLDQTTSDTAIEDHQDATLDEVPFNTTPDEVIKGNPAVIKYQVLNDKRHIITQESDHSVALYDVLKARKVECLQHADNQATAKLNFDAEVKNRFKMVYVPNWFSVDLKIGLLCIHLEEGECFSAWVSARDYNLVPHLSQDPKVNLGCLMLKALLEYWPPTYENCDVVMKGLQNPNASSNDSNMDNLHSFQYTKSTQLSMRQKNSIIVDRHNATSANGTVKVGNQYFSIASHTPIIVSEGNQTLLKLLAQEASNENEDIFLQEIIPSWISDIVISRCQPKFTKIPFFLLPHANSGIKSLRKERLSASDMLQMRKVIEHVCEKMIVNVLDENVSGQEGSNFRTSLNLSIENGHFPPDKVELYCNDTKLEESLDLRTVRHYIWKSGSDLILHYMPIR